MQDIRISLNTLWSLLDITADLSLTVSFFKAPGSVEKTAISTLFIIVIVPLLSGARVISKVSTLPLPTYISSQSNTLVIHHSPVNCDNTSCKRFFTIHLHQLWYCHPIAGFPGGGSSEKKKKHPLINAKDLRNEGSTPGSGRFPEEELATHSSTLAWRIPWTEEPLRHNTQVGQY